MDEKELARQGEGAEGLPQRGQMDKGMGRLKREGLQRQPGARGNRQQSEGALKARAQE